MAGALLGFDVAELVEAGLVATALELGGEEDVDEAEGEGVGQLAGAEGEDVGVVVEAAHAGRPLVVAQGGAGAVDLVGRDLLALAAAAHDDGPVGPPAVTSRAAAAQNLG